MLIITFIVSLITAIKYDNNCENIILEDNDSLYLVECPNNIDLFA